MRQVRRKSRPWRLHAVAAAAAVPAAALAFTYASSEPATAVFPGQDTQKVQTTPVDSITQLAAKACAAVSASYAGSHDTFIEVNNELVYATGNTATAVSSTADEDTWCELSPGTSVCKRTNHTQSYTLTTAISGSCYHPSGWVLANVVTRAGREMSTEGSATTHSPYLGISSQSGKVMYMRENDDHSWELIWAAGSSEREQTLVTIRPHREADHISRAQNTIK